MRLQLVTPLGPNCVLVKDVLVCRVDSGRRQLRQLTECRGVVCRVLAALARPVGQMGQLGQQNGGLQRIETRIGPDLFMMVLLRATMETQFLEAVCGGVIGRYHHAAISPSAEILSLEKPISYHPP